MLLVQNHWESFEQGAARRSDHVRVSEHVLVATRWKLLGPVNDGRFEEATATQLEEGNQVPHHT